VDNTVGSLAIHNQTLSKRQTAIVVGSLLGDGCLEKREKGTRLRLDHGAVQKSYLLWKHEELKNIAGKILKVNYFHKGHNKSYENYRFSTFSSELFNFYWSKFYVNKKKIIPSDIEKFLHNPLALAIWFMDDGYKRNDCNALRLNTDSFSFSENVLLQKTLQANFGIRAAIHKKGRYWNLYIPERYTKTFVDLVRPFMHKTLDYKIALTL